MMQRQWICNGVEFREGDKVMVVAVGINFDPDGMGEGVEWDNTWEGDGVDGMYKAIFHEYTIDHITEEGVFFEELSDTNENYGFPLNVLKKI